MTGRASDGFRLHGNWKSCIDHFDGSSLSRLAEANGRWGRGVVANIAAGASS